MSGRNLANMARGISTAHLVDHAVTSDKIASYAITQTKVAAGVIGHDALAPEATPVVTKRAESLEYDITPMGLISWAHGLGEIPKKVDVILKCITADRGYNPGDLVPFPVNNIPVGGNNHNFAVTKDAVSVRLRFGGQTGVFGGGGSILIIRMDNGGAETIVNDHWKLIIIAEA
jgi:hypothetical protein